MKKLSRETQALLRRLVIAAAVIVVLVLGSFALIRAGIWVPWWVPVLAFAVIVVAALARAHEVSAAAAEEEAEGQNGIAGRIGGED